MRAGYFPFKYNRDVRNLGEYLFRSGTYPQFILNSVDFPLARLMGGHARFSPLRDLTLDALFFTNLQWYAVGDWNCAGIVAYKAFDIIDISIGFSLNSIISTDSTMTTPRNPATVYHITYNATTGERDSSFYTFKGSKVMGRACIDFKRLFDFDRFGREDLRLYTEAAILGLRDYPRNLRGGISYDSIMERIPVMIGFTIPTFSIHPRSNTGSILTSARNF